MSNMSYCRFRNTLSELQDCQGALEDGALDVDELSQDEKEAAIALICVCSHISKDFDEGL